MTRPAIPFIDLATQQKRIRAKVDAAVARVLDHGQYILGPEVAQLEAEMAAFSGVKHAIACSNGTDALTLCLMARGVGPGDVVLCPSFTFASTAEVVAQLGATPFFVDIEEGSFNLSPASLRAALDHAREIGMKVVGLISVDLFGQPADYDSLEPIVEEAGIWLLCDAAQGYGGVYKNRKVGTIGDFTTTSFFPAKPLGCYGDGGAIYTNDDDTAALLRSLLFHGKGSDRYDNVRIGMNGRLDTIQAAILIEKLALFPEEIVSRNAVADRYENGLSNVLTTPRIAEGSTSVWAQYCVRAPGKNRGAILAKLAEAGVPTAVYYPKPLHQQTAYRDFPTAPNGLPMSEEVAQDIFALPMHPYLDASTQDYIIDQVAEAVRAA
ncbi:DegT/DnrJ/EryC1/StrS family aminotransferase [Tianweitania sediminis]|uniref:DegT/DnrJ/EryC1/StrS family aminotransferase n=1 Tax=Tianweitania sediminis TaxID=1502156 RepID=A0A8J7UH53_9HYPH|nr:DegT/DnrJ/EryC1/StrS family aminotransferase [Tianweitania sediminis]MBP0438829.1 DegT/DnrJ/EryC1/StrS family aminotransferase [Tianweitania sediminis]